MSGRTIGRGATLHVRMTSAGPLRTGAKVRLAGEEIGEVRTAQTRRGPHGVEVDFEIFVARAYLPGVHRNSDFFVSTPSVLGEAFLEVGPPRDHAAPGPVVVDGDQVQGADPPDIDRFFVHAEASIREVLALMRDSRGELDALLAAADSLLATLSGLPADRGQLRRIVDQGGAALDQGRALLATLRESGAIERARRIGRELGAIADRVAPELSALGDKVTRAIDRIDDLRTLFPKARRQEVEAALQRVRQAIASFQKVGDDVRWLAARVARGEGTFGALLADKELFDDLHESHRIIKGQPLRFLLKTVKPKEPLGSP